MSSLNGVLVATDLSHCAARAEIRAATLCAEHQCGAIELLTVKELGMPDTLARIMHSTADTAQTLIAGETMRELQARAVELADHHGVQCAATVRFGRPATEIVRRADEIAAGLTVVGAHGRNFFTDLFVGNTADKLAHLCKRPLLVVKSEPAQAYRRVLVPVDFSEDSRQAALLALALAPAAEVTFLHAFEVWFEGQMQYANVSRDVINDYRIKAREEARIELNSFIDGLNAGSRPLARAVTFGLPGPVIREHARATKPDLIVLGKHGRSRFEEMIIGSVTRDTIDQTDGDILIVPSP